MRRFLSPRWLVLGVAVILVGAGIGLLYLRSVEHFPGPLEVAVLDTPEPSPEITPTPDPTSTPEPTPDPAGFSVATAMEHTRVLSVDIGWREAGTEGDRQAAAYIREQFAGLGYEARFQTFPLPQGGESQNVVAMPEGLDPATERHLLVGGHMDSLRGPGANDNATGTAVVLEAARALRIAPGPLPVVFVAFGAEEQQPTGDNHIGSRHYVAQMSAPERDNLVAMMSVDMVGRGEDVIIGRTEFGPTEAWERTERVAAEIGVPHRAQVLRPWSDHASFSREGMNASWLWAGEDAAFHSPRDTFDRVQPEPVEWAGRITVAFLRSYE